jgi:predicted DNA-binding transcriptional regulator AlpA
MKLIIAMLEELIRLVKSQSLDQKELLSFKEACQLLHMSESKLYKLTATQNVPHRKKGKLFFSRKELIAWALDEGDQVGDS